MKYPNAYNGIKKLFTGELLSIFSFAAVALSGILLVISTTVYSASAGTAADNSEGVYNDLLSSFSALPTLGIVFFGLVIAGMVIGLISLIFSIIGVAKASKDEKKFKTAFILLVLGLIISVVKLFFISNTFIQNIGDTAQTICELCATIYVIAGSDALAESLGRNDIIKLGRKIMTLIGIFYALIIISRITESLAAKGILGSTVYTVISLIADLLSLVQYIIYLVYLNKTKKMLKQEEAIPTA